MKKKVFRWALGEPVLPSGVPFGKWKDEYIEKYKKEPTQTVIKSLGLRNEQSTLDIISFAVDAVVLKIEGIEQFRKMQRIAKAMNEAKETIELEKEDLAFLHATLEEKVPASWAFNPFAVEALEDFMKEE